MNLSVFIKNLTTGASNTYNLPKKSEVFLLEFRGFVAEKHEYILEFDKTFNVLHEHIDAFDLNSALLEMYTMKEEQALADSVIEVMMNRASNLEEVLSILSQQSYIIRTDVDEWRDVAEQYVEDHDILNRIPEDLREYFDYDAFGRNLMTGSYRFWNDFTKGISIEIFS